MIISTFRRSISTCVISLCKSQRFSKGRGIRNKRFRTYAKDLALPANPGIHHRLTAMTDDKIEENSIPEMDLLENSEANFYNVGSQYREIKRDQELNDELLALRIVKRKYFKEHIVNFLTWSEKEQIRHLHSKDPVEWTPEIIAESFPTTPEGAKNIIKATWKPATQTRIDRHDASVFRNWKELQQGTLNDISPELREHLLKFTKRTIPPRHKTAIAETKELSPGIRIRGEFSKIITSYEDGLKEVLNNDTIDDSTEALSHIHGENLKIESKDKNELDPMSWERDFGKIQIGESVQDDTAMTYIKVNEPSEENKRSMPKKKDKLKQIVTLNELRSNLVLSSANDCVPFTENNVNSDYTNLLTSNNAIQADSKTYIQKYKENVPLQKIADTQTSPEKVYPERIRIPKKAFRKGLTYKIDDCFYDDDGMFLYRVPGLVES